MHLHQRPLQLCRSQCFRVAVFAKFRQEPKVAPVSRDRMRAGPTLNSTLSKELADAVHACIWLKHHAQQRGRNHLTNSLDVQRTKFRVEPVLVLAGHDQ